MLFLLIQVKYLGKTISFIVKGQVYGKCQKAIRDFDLSKSRFLAI
jgi:hypothetical protein